jgi:ComF family protein
VIFPTTCAICGAELIEASATSVCRACWSSLEPWQGAVCARCGLPFATTAGTEGAEQLCAECQLAPRDFDEARSYGLYAGALRQTILLLKFRRQERLGKRLGELLAPLWMSLSKVEDPLLIPVPLHRTRQRERGFNQAELLARGLLRALGRAGRQQPRLAGGILRRTRATPPQTGLSVEARRENVRGVFAVRQAERLRGRSIVLVDDVMTTGATLSECAATLMRAGARHVLALTLARATPQFPDAGTPREAIDEFASDWT